MTTATNLDIRALNRWLKVNVPFHAKAVRRPHREVMIGADSGDDLHAYAVALRAEFGGDISEVRAYGLPNYITLITR